MNVVILQAASPISREMEIKRDETGCSRLLSRSLFVVVHRGGMAETRGLRTDTAFGHLT